MSTLIVALTAMTTLGAPIPSYEVKKQTDSFEQLWSEKFVWKFAELPKKGGVDKFHVPYSGFIYPDRSGGLLADFSDEANQVAATENPDQPFVSDNRDATNGSLTEDARCVFQRLACVGVG